MSVTQALLDEYGDSKACGDARDAGGVNVKATDITTNKPWVGLLPAQAWYKGVGDRNGISENYMYSGTAVRLRELSLAYNIPTHAKGISNLTVSLDCQESFLFYKPAPFDPEVTMATDNGLQGMKPSVFLQREVWVQA